MPVAGVARNPLGETPNRFRARQQVFVQQPGRTPGLQDIDLRADTQAAGTIRRLYRQAINYLAATSPYSWTANEAAGDGSNAGGGFQITRALRYKASTTYRGAGSDNTRFGAPRPVVAARHNMPLATRSAGDQQNRPVIRNRMLSFGRRVPPLNNVSPAAQQP